MGNGDASPAVAACLRALDGGAWTLEGIVAQRDNSRIHRARCGSRTAAIKECLTKTTHAPDNAAAEREFAALTAVAENATACGIEPLAPTPLILCREHAVYAMAWASGQTATDLVLAPTTDLELAEVLGGSAGGWLQRFHACKTLPARQNDFATRLIFVKQLARTEARRDSVLPRAANILVQCAENAAGVLMPASWVHGDMKSDNLLIDADRVTGLDVQMVDVNTVAYDLAPFLNHLYLLRWSPRGFLRQRQLDRMSAGFLQAYSPDSEKWALPLLWLRSYLLMQIVANSKKSASLRALAARWPARRELAIAIDALELCR